ncbi:MAG: HEAT repeat domain-containing protein, partial [Planctomycetota bacterium]|nr:HEAT repeat domain-containing protein [Planctomycetota bacterium]
MTGRKSAAFNRAPGFVLGVVWCALAWSPGFAQDAKTKTLIQQLQSPEQFARMAAAGKVAELGPGAADAAPALIEALKCERMDVMFENPQIAASRRSFADSLVRLGSPVTPQIEQALNDANGLVRVWSAYALFKIDSVKHRGKVVRALMDSLREDDDTAADAAMVLELMGSDAAPAIPLLIQQLAHADLGVRCNSAHALVAIAKGDQLRPLTEALKHEQPLVRVGAAYVLQRGQRDLSVDAKIVLQEALDNEASAVRTQAVWAIGQLGSVAQPLAKPLIAVLPRLNPDIREYFFGGGGLGRQSFDPSMVLVATGPKTKEDLIQALEGEDLKGRLMAAVALLRLDPSQKERVDTVFAAVREAPDQSLRFFANLSAPPVAPAAKPDLEGLIREVLQTNGFGPPSP